MIITREELGRLGACYSGLAMFSWMGNKPLDSRSKKTIYKLCRYGTVKGYPASYVTLGMIGWYFYNTKRVELRKQFRAKFYNHEKFIYNRDIAVSSLAEWLYYHLNKEGD